MATYLYDRSRRGLSLLTPPVKEPVTVDIAKKHLRVDIADDDDYIKLLISTARDWVERYTRRALYKQQWCLTLDRFPTWGDTDDPYFWLYRRGIVDLVVPPVMAVDSIKYIDTNGSEQTLDPTTYNVDLQDDSVRIEPVYGQFWPITQFRIMATKFTYTCGYTDGIKTPPPDPLPDPWTPTADNLPADGDPLNKIPPPIKHAILLLVAHMYENREMINMSMGGGNLLPFGVEDLLGPYRTIRF